MSTRTFVVASGNPGKIKDFQTLFGPLGIDVVPITDLFPDFDPVETGQTFLENAILKGRAGAHTTGLPCLADDSGLVVDALGGAPGIYSARYAGGLGDEANIEKLLLEMESVPDDQRTARFVSVVALILPDGEAFTSQGTLEGRILREKRGHQGFGYDPVFFIPSLDRTMAELSLTEKNQISHRKRAFSGIEKTVKELLATLF